MKFCNYLFIFHQKQKQIRFQIIKHYCFQFVFSSCLSLRLQTIPPTGETDGRLIISNTRVSFWWVIVIFSTLLPLLSLLSILEVPVPVIKDAKMTLASHEMNFKEADSSNEK